MIRPLLAWLLLTFAWPAAVAAEEVPGWSAYDQLVRKYAVVTDKAKGVKYREWKNNAQDVAALRGVLDQWARVNPDQLPRRVRHAFYLNLYNATMLDVVLRHYPLQSVTKLTDQDFGIFEEPLVRMDGKKLTLNRLEKTILMSQFRDPRNHFAINCASISCPPLANFAYDGKNLNDQLKYVTRAFAKTSQAFRLNSDKRQIAYSKIFDWYKADFAPESPHRFLTRALGEYVPPDYEEVWLEYDWSLNDASP